MLTEEVVGGPDARSTVARATRSAEGAPGNAYDEGARTALRVIELVPRRNWVLGLLFSLGLTVIGGLLAVYRIAADRWADGTLPRSLDVALYGSLAAWLSSVLLVVQSAVALLVYSLRRHKKSDYHGRYRVWLWASCAALGMSVCAASPVHLAMAGWLSGFLGWSLPGGMLLYWLVPAVLLIGVIFVRLFLDVRACRLAATALTLAPVGYLTAIGVPHVSSLAPSTAVILSAGSALLGHFLFLFGTLLFARHVLLEIDGQLPARTRRAKATTKSNQPAAPTKAGVKVDSSHATPPAPLGRSDVEPEAPLSRYCRETVEAEEDRYDSEVATQARNRRRPSSRNDSDDRDDEDDDSNFQHRKLSKAERKRLRRLKAQQRGGEY